MTRRLLSITLAVLTVGLLGSCAKINDRIDSLEGRIDRIESDRIASIDQQIAAINSSISDLGTIRQNIQNLIDTTDGQEKDINSLKTADASLGQRIDELKAYTDETLKAYVKSDWVKATFATLEQHEWTCDTVAKIDARIGKIDKKISESIKDSEESLRSWVNAQMESYYTAAQMDAKVAELLSEIAAASGESEAKADSLAVELTEAQTAIATVKTELTEAYQSAIEEAIKSSEGKLSSRISSSVSSVNSKVSALADRVDDLEDEVDDLTDKIKALEGRIQSVTIIPAYSDGSVEAEGNNLKINFIVSPASALENVTTDDIKVLVNTVKTKAATFKTVPAATATINESNGEVTITADISSIQVEGDKALTVAINVKNGISDFTTEFVPVTVSENPIETIADVLATVDGGFPEGTGNMKEPPSNAWASGTEQYAFVVSTSSSAIIFYNRDVDNATYVLLTTAVTPGENCYTATSSNNDGITLSLTFNMTAGKLTSIIFSGATESMQKYDGTYDTFLVDLKMARAGESVSDWNKIAILIKGTDVVSGKYYFNKSSDEKFAGNLENLVNESGVELTNEQIESVNNNEGLHIVQENLDGDTEYKTVLVVSNSAGYSKTIVTTYQTGQSPPP